MKPRRPSKPRAAFVWEEFMDPYVRMWRALTPAERLRRSWRMRRRVKNLQAIHDAKSLPKL